MKKSFIIAYTLILGFLAVNCEKEEKPHLTKMENITGFLLGHFVVDKHYDAPPLGPQLKKDWPKLEIKPFDICNNCGMTWKRHE